MKCFFLSFFFMRGFCSSQLQMKYVHDEENKCCITHLSTDVEPVFFFVFLFFGEPVFPKVVDFTVR